jgi:hypothetical protein
MGYEYEPGEKLVNAVLEAIRDSLPWPMRAAFWIVPFKETIMSTGISYAMPLALVSIASVLKTEGRMPLTSSGGLTEQTKIGLVKKIAWWLVPDKVSAVIDELHHEVLRLGDTGYATDSYKLEKAGDDVYIVVLRPSLMRETADTAIEYFLRTAEVPGWVANRIMSIFPKQEEATPAQPPAPQIANETPRPLTEQ